MKRNVFRSGTEPSTAHRIDFFRYRIERARKFVERDPKNNIRTC